MNDVLGYAAWNNGETGDTQAANITFVKSAEELRQENRTHRILTPEEAIQWVRGGAPLPLHPIIGGAPPEIAWRYLETVAEKVVPALR
jgi:hypothetical protein